MTRGRFLSDLKRSLGGMIGLWAVAADFSAHMTSGGLQVAAIDAQRA